LGRLRLQQKLVPGMIPGGRGGRCVVLTVLAPSCADWKFWEPEPPGALRAWCRVSFTSSHFFTF
jgi:hypothetical protein